MEPYDVIARYYDLEHSDFLDDVHFYLGYVREGPVLEVGAGTGRVTRPLAGAGFEVWGIDPSEEMLSVAARRLENSTKVHLLANSLSSLDLATRFRTALMPLNTLWHMATQEEQIHGLANLRRHTANGALLIVDLSNPLTMADKGSTGEVRQRFHAHDDGRDVRGWSASWDDSAEQTLALTLIYDEVGRGGHVERTSADLTLRYLYRGEVALLLRNAGFAILHEYGSYDLEPYTASSPNLLVVAEAI